MTEKYPFFREADEQTKAVIGEDTIASDLNGTYQKPYAVLTQKRLYCKNERGNFIVGADQLLWVNLTQNPFTQDLLWVAFAAIALSIIIIWFGRTMPTDEESIYLDNIFIAVAAICLIAFLVCQRMRFKISPILLCIAPVVRIISAIAICNYAIGRNFYNKDASTMYIIIETLTGSAHDNTVWPIAGVPLIVAIILCIISVVKGKSNRWFEVRHSTGTFTFSPKLYPAGELKNFEQQVKAMRAGGANGR